VIHAPSTARRRCAQIDSNSTYLGLCATQVCPGLELHATPLEDGAPTLILVHLLLQSCLPHFHALWGDPGRLCRCRGRHEYLALRGVFLPHLFALRHFLRGSQSRACYALWSADRLCPSVMVIPAYAGIQDVPQLWIPACAGMTLPLCIH